MITVKLFHDTRREKVTGTYPVKVRITSDRRSKYYETGVNLTEAEFNRIFMTRVPAELQERKEILAEAESKAVYLLKDIKPFNFPAFERRFLQKSFDGSFVETIFNEVIERFRQQDRIGTAESYKVGLRKLLKFKPRLRFEDVDATFLYKFEEWMLEQGNSITTVGIYTRALRAIFNEAIERNLISKEYYPFTKRRYQVPTGKSVKKALPLADIGRIYHYETKTPQEEKAKAYWLFSYFANGMNMADIARLKYKDISGDFIHFERAKTIRSMRGNPKVISVVMNDDIRLIMKKWGNWNKTKDNYIFPILEAGLTSAQERERIKDLIWRINKGLKSIATELKFDKPLTTYTARHSFSTVLKRSGASVEFISESLGHRSVQTTAHYLDSFEDDMKKKYSESLLGFMENSISKSADK
ncbi:tyrosine-type recombinase/integrase [Sediminibacterium soli]|uniref:tyrosine-type recombinase/integrase n=1 Tax=Sediminibacterium soli TaxID=2698829 RepID=UPI00137995B8|nr:site-specific integrase [Sediminibacterium soli]NCI45029.1 site-specific integrase [Sediminibacterium soli]